jgi:hypothetical protein
VPTQLCRSPIIAFRSGREAGEPEFAAARARETPPGTDGGAVFLPSSGTATTAPVTSTAAATMPNAALRSVVCNETGGRSADESGSRPKGGS